MADEEGFDIGRDLLVFLASVLGKTEYICENDEGEGAKGDGQRFPSCFMASTVQTRNMRPKKRVRNEHTKIAHMRLRL